MELAYLIGGGSAFMKKYRVDDGAAIAAGVPVLPDGDTANTQGVVTGTTTSNADMIGVTTDQVDASTGAQVAATGGQLGDGINATFANVIINADAVWRAKLSGAATEDTATTLLTQTSASTTGLAVTGATDEATIWGLTGANAGQVRFATAAATVVVAMPYDIAVGDTFSEVLLNIATPTQTPTLTTALTQVAAATAIAASKNFLVVEFDLKDASDSGRTNSFAMLVAYDHAFSGSALA
jgi:hypothetical protein